MFASRALATHCLVIACAAFFLIAVFGLSHFGMNMSADGTMSDCPFMGVTALCTMDIFQHLSGWQQMFASAMPQLATFALLLLIAFLRPSFFENFCAYSPRVERLILYHRHNFWIFDPLRSAFADGLIHPKVF